MTMKEFYGAISGDYDEALTRLMNESMMSRFVKKFADDQSFEELEQNLAADRTEEAFRAAHTLKGVCKNLAFTALADVSSEITEMLRAGDLAAAKEYFPVVKEKYDVVLAEISELEK